MSKPLNITDAEFQEKVMENDLPVIVDFWAPWCGPCKMVGPILDKMAVEYDGKMVITKVNTDEHPAHAQEYGVRGIPTMLFVSGGKVVHRQTGALPEPMLREVVDQFLEAIEEAV
jgi:thioredoxin 1